MIKNEISGSRGGAAVSAVASQQECGGLGSLAWGLVAPVSAQVLQVPTTAETCTSWLTWHLQEMDGWTRDLKYQQTHSFSFICDEFVRFFVVKLGKASLQSPKRWILSPQTLCFILCVSARLPPGLGNKVKPQKGFIADPATQARPN